MADSNVNINVNADTSDATRGLNGLNTQLHQTEQQLGEAGSASEAMGKKLTGIGTIMAHVGLMISTAVTLPILGMAGASIKMASDFNENVNKVDVIFKKNGGNVKTWAKGMVDHFGIAEGSALQMVSMFGDMGGSMGLTSSQTMNMSKKLVELAGDMASFKNIPIAESQTALQGIFTGEGEALKSMGIAMTVANLSAFALSSGSKKLYKDMSEAEKIQVRYNYILSVTKASQGDFARTSDQFANATRTAGERIKELGTALGERLMPLITPLVIKFNEFLAGLRTLSPAMQDNILWFAGFIAILGPLVIVIGVIVAGIGIFMTAGLTLCLWVAGAVLAFVALIAGLVLLAKNWDAVSAKVTELTTAFTVFKDQALAFIIAKFNEFKQMLSDNEGKIHAVATVLEVIFMPALIKTALTAVAQGAVIVGSFVWSLICMSAQAIATGAVMTIQFIGSMIKTGAQAILTGITMTASIIATLIVYAAKAWIGVAKTLALTVAWVAQKVVMLLMKVALLAYNIIVLAYNVVVIVATAVTGAFGAIMAFVCSPIGLVVIAIIALIAIGLALTGNWGKVKSVASSVWNGIKSSVGGAIDWIKSKVASFKSYFSNMFTGVKMPHFTFSGSMNPIDWIKGGLPSVGLTFHAKGGIFNQPTDMGGGNIIGEAGAEALIPLSNSNAVKPFAKAVASQFNLLQPDKDKGSTGDTIVNIINPVVKDETDMKKFSRQISEEIYKAQERTRRSRGGSINV